MAKILLVDDVYTARSMIERVLRHVGRYEVYSVDSGHEALAVAELNPPDVIILDINMASMDGLQTLYQLRALGVLCPVVAYTARTERASGEFVSQGFSAYVSKNGNLSGLLTTVRELIGR
ncbi:response regulator [Oscillochloris sp. ZM17-4]|uniref:response regulator n=1 Tax=Oscillochloris sp. ZM17-4 TaxID=2866714 RepID=UPI001C72F187|nr:response regulator [Oscillochloris sp. ZM17-4]MBX0326538.1 response regulator [Oscillochloris sp. ZM17-4]